MFAEHAVGSEEEGQKKNNAEEKINGEKNPKEKGQKKGKEVRIKTNRRGDIRSREE